MRYDRQVATTAGLTSLDPQKALRRIQITLCVHGVVSPVLANRALDGLEEVAKQAAPRGQKVNVVKYADDFIITGASKEVLEMKVKPAVVAFLKERGLELSEEKTHITHIDDGF